MSEANDEGVHQALLDDTPFGITELLLYGFGRFSAHLAFCPSHFSFGIDPLTEGSRSYKKDI